MDMIWDRVTKSFIPLGIGENKWFSTSHRRMEVGQGGGDIYQTRRPSDASMWWLLDVKGAEVPLSHKPVVLEMRSLDQQHQR